MWTQEFYSTWNWTKQFGIKLKNKNAYLPLRFSTKSSYRCSQYALDLTEAETPAPSVSIEHTNKVKREQQQKW